MKTKTFLSTTLIALVILLAHAPLSYATFNISVDTTQFNFGLMNFNEQKSDVPSRGVIVTCSSDQGKAWKLNIYNERPFTHESNPVQQISNSDFYWYGVSTNGGGILKKIAEDFTFEKTVYESLSGEGSPPVSVEVRFRLDIHEFIQSGRYNTRIVFTMFE